MEEIEVEERVCKRCGEMGELTKSDWKQDKGYTNFVFKCPSCELKRQWKKK